MGDQSYTSALDEYMFICNTLYPTTDGRYTAKFVGIIKYPYKPINNEI